MCGEQVAQSLNQSFLMPRYMLPASICSERVERGDIDAQSLSCPGLNG